MTKSTVHLRQLTLILGLTVAASACSTISDLDPTGLLSDSSDSAPVSQFPDQAAPTASDDTVSTTPDLASLPARPAPTATAGDQQQTAQALASDGAQARYSADALRGGTEAAAPPPAASDAAPNAATQRLLSTASAPPAASDAPPTAAPDAAPPAPQIAAATPPPAAAPPPAAVASVPALRTTDPSASEPAVPANAPVRTAALPGVTATPVGPSAGSATPKPAVPANASVRGGAVMAPPAASDTALGFKPSSAPPLDPSVGQFVSAPIVARYRQTASLAGGPMTSTAAVPAVPPKGRGSDNGSVVANLDAGPGRAALMNGGTPPTAVVYFSGDGVALSKAAHAQVRAAVAAFKAGGGQGSIRVIGHASSRTGNMSVEKHLETIFAKSQGRANAVAQDLIRQGVPAAKVLIDAVGDSQPVYYESMPKGEAGNRRAEIFVQS